ncbi:formate hydrogenlyase maturation HycH family protein [Celerinatantimonas sp. YJH-8]|uniref:formate hydrogenlyase maturation HycH family protein n=1 Tax=Celerinatantimonas sp. YJH-8 TaxID=3228714 RepID=UPI0038C52D53
MSETVTFFILSRKFVDEKDAKPEAQQLVYYGLAIGHHLGVVDCFEPVMSCPLEEYLQWIALIEAPEARRKLEGIPKYGEIVIDRSHVVMLAQALAQLPESMPSQWKLWRHELMKMLNTIQEEPAIHLVVRRLHDS